MLIIFIADCYSSGLAAPPPDRPGLHLLVQRERQAEDDALGVAPAGRRPLPVPRQVRRAMCERTALSLSSSH